MKYPLHNSSRGQVSHLQELWENGRFVLTLQPPPLLSADAGEFIAQIAARAHLFDAALVSEAPGGAVALSSLAVAVLLKRVGIEAIVQVSGRDRNRLALQSDILGIGSLGIPNLLVDMSPVTRGTLTQNADARLVTDLDGAALLATSVKMSVEARFISGAGIKTPPALYIGATFQERQHQIDTIMDARFLVTPFVHDIEHFAASLAVFQTAHPTYLQTRPLLVSLPLLVDPGEAVAGKAQEEATFQQFASSIGIGKRIPEVRGFNIVIAQQADLSLVEQIIPQVMQRTL